MTSSAGSSSLKRRLGNLARKTSNRTCCDCPEKSPTWAVLIEPPSLMKGSTLVAFLCFSCAECHKGLLASEEESPEFSARVKHLTLDKWTEEEVDNAERSGNKKVNFIYEALLKEQEEKCGSRLKPISGSHGASRVRYIREKYVDREFYSTAAHYKCIQHDTEGTPWSPTTPLGSRRSLNFFMASSSKGVNDAAGGEVSVFSGNSSSKQYVGTKSTSASTTKENSSSSRRKFSLASLTSPIRSRLSPVKKAKPPPVTSATLPLTSTSDSDEAPSRKGLAHMLEQNKNEVSERTRSERSTASEPVKSGKDNYRDPRRAEFMNSRSSLDFTMDDLDLPTTKTTNKDSLKKGPGTIKIPVAAIASTVSATPKSTSARVNMYSKTTTKDRRSRSSSRNRATSKTSETQRPRTRSSSRHNLERDGRGRSRGASQTHRHTRTSKSPSKGLHSRTSSPTKRSSSQQRDHRTPSPPKRSTRISKSPRRVGRVSKSPRRGERGISRSNSELDITSSPKSRRSLVRAQMHASFNKLSSEQNLTKRTSLVRSRSGRGGTRNRSASRTRRPTSPDKPSSARSRSSSALRKDASDSGRSFRKSDQAALREAANRQNARRERSRSRSSRALSDVQSSKEDNETPKFKIEVPKPGDKDYAELEKSLSVMPSTADDSSSAEDEGYTEPLKGASHKAEASHHSTSDLELSDKAQSSGRDEGHKSLSTFVPSTKTTNNPSLSAKLRKEKSNFSKFHNSFGGTSKTATVTSSGSGSSKESNAISLSLESAVGLKYQNDDDDPKEGEESFEVISTAVGHRSLQGLKKGSSFNRQVPSRKHSSTQPKRCHSYVHPTTYLDDLGDEAEDGMLSEHRIIHGGGDKFQNSKSRMSKTKAAEKDAERASRKSSIFAALDMDDDDWKSPPPSTSKGPLGLRRMAPMRSKSGDTLLMKPAASAVRMGETERNQAPRRRVPPRSKSEAGSSSLLRQYQQSLNDIPSGDDDHDIDGVGKFHTSIGGRQPQQAPRVVAKLNVPSLHKSEAFPRKRPPTRSKSDVGRATTMLHLSKRLSGTSTTSIPEDDFSENDDHDDKEKTMTTNGRTSSVRLTDFDRSFDALDFTG